jgi:hypothetical protein
MPMMRGIAGGNAQLQAVVTTGVAAAAPMASFDAARKSAELRAARSIDALDSVSGERGRTNIKRVGNVTFVLRDSVWTDTRKASGPVIKVKAFSAAYFTLIEIIPDLREPLSVGERAKISGRAVTIEIGPSGVDKLNERDITMLKQGW